MRRSTLRRLVVLGLTPLLGAQLHRRLHRALDYRSDETVLLDTACPQVPIAERNVRLELLATRRCPKLEYIFKVSIVLFTLFEDNNWKFLPLPKKIFLTLRVCTGQGTCTCNGHYYTYFLHVGTYIHCNVGTYMQKVITTPNHHHLPCVDGLGKGYRRVVCVWYDLTYNSDGHP